MDFSYSTFITYLGLFDAGVIMLGGLVGAFVIMVGWDAEKLWERIFPATALLIGSNVAAAIVLGAMVWLAGSTI